MRADGVEVEGGLTPTCGHAGCGAPVGFGIRSMAEASARLREHYADKHGGAEP